MEDGKGWRALDGLDPTAYIRFDVSVEDSIPVHVLDCLEELVDIEFDPVLWQVVCPSLDGFIEVHLHQLEDQG